MEKHYPVLWITGLYSYERMSCGRCLLRNTILVSLFWLWTNFFRFFIIYFLISSTRVPGYSMKKRSSTRVFESRVVWNHRNISFNIFSILLQHNFFFRHSIIKVLLHRQSIEGTYQTFASDSLWEKSWR